jgi:uncharacterized protein (DUF58 family)
MDKHDLLRKISTFPLIAADLAEDLLAGDFVSVFRGQGMEFDEVRRYEAGDDVRRIDWNVSARFGTPYVKLYREEREISLCLVLDCSASMHTGSGVLSRYEQGVLAAALLAFSAERTGQRVGALFFAEDITRVFRAGKGRAHIMAVLSAALDARPAGRGSGLGKALEGTARLLRARHFRRNSPRSLVAVISDFMCINWEREMAALCADHDVIAIRLSDPADLEIGDAGLVSLEDNETGHRLYAATAFRSFRESWAAWHRDRDKLWQAACRRWGAATLPLSTAEDAVPVLARFFRNQGAAFPRRRG